MSKKTRIVPQRRPTKRQLSRWQKEKQVQRFILAGGAFAILLVLAIPIFGFAREYAFKGQESVARVEKSVFHLSDYAQILGLRYYQMDSQLDNLQQAIGQANAQKSGGQSGDQTGNQGGDPLQANLQSLQQARLSLPYQILEDWISEQLVRQEASRQGLTVTPDEVTKAIKPESDPITADGSDPKPLSDEEFQTRYRDFLKRARTTDALYRRLEESRLLRQKLQERLAEQVQSPAPQVHLQDILVGTEDEAKAVMDRLGKGEDFAQVAKEVSQDQLSKDQGGDLGWAPRGLLDIKVEDAAFSAKVGEVSGPVETVQGFYIFKVTEREESREIEASTLDMMKASALDIWLEEAQQNAKIERYLTSDQATWAEKQTKRR